MGAALAPGKRKAVILTLDREDRIETEEGVVEVRAAWRWMAEGRALYAHA
jgi:hypothetical protein